MKISILCTDKNHPVVSSLIPWQKKMIQNGHSVTLNHDKSSLSGGDILFLVSCSQIVNNELRNKFQKTLVLHASDLPMGRGWSPHIWAILDGMNKITVSLIEANDQVDTGMIWYKKTFTLDGDELLDEINAKLFDVEVSLMTLAIENFATIKPTPQKGDSGNYLRKRTADDSKVNIKKSIIEQFNLLRVVDNDRYPAYFYHLGFKYYINITKAKDE